MGVFMVFSFLGVSQPQYQRFASVPTLAQAQLYVGNMDKLNGYSGLKKKKKKNRVHFPNRRSSFLKPCHSLLQTVLTVPLGNESPVGSLLHLRPRRLRSLQGLRPSDFRKD